MTEAGQIAMAAAIGDTAEALGGGKFANGAVTGAWVMRLNHMGGEDGSPNDDEVDAISGPARSTSLEDENDYFIVLHIIEENAWVFQIEGYVGIYEINGEYFVTTHINSNITEFNGWKLTGNLRVTSDGTESFQLISMKNDPSYGVINKYGRQNLGSARIKLPNNTNKIQLNIHMHKDRFFEGSSIFPFYRLTFE